MNPNLRKKLKENRLVNSVYRILTSKECRNYCAEFAQNARMFRFTCLGEENQGKNIYFICEGESSSGMFALVTWTLRQLEVADRFHFTPVVLWTDDVPYSIGDGTNPFLLYYQSVSDVSIESAMRSAVVAFAQKWNRAYGLPAGTYDFTQEEIDRLAPIYQKYLKLQPSIQSKIDHELEDLFGKTHDKVLGIHVRGIEFRKMQVAGHPIPVAEEDYLHTAQIMMQESGYEKVFLASDCEETIELFRSTFGDRLITTEALRSNSDSGALAIFNEDNDPYQLGFEILRDAYALAACDSLICGLSYVSYGVRIINQITGKPYKEVIILDKGRAHKGISAQAATNKAKKTLNKGKTAGTK